MFISDKYLYSQQKSKELMITFQSSHHGGCSILTRCPCNCSATNMCKEVIIIIIIIFISTNVSSVSFSGTNGCSDKKEENSDFHRSMIGSNLNGTNMSHIKEQFRVLNMCLCAELLLALSVKTDLMKSSLAVGPLLPPTQTKFV